MALSVALALGILALGAYLITQGRRDAWARAERESSNLVRALERDVSRNIRLIELSLQGVIEGLAEPGIGQASPEVRHRALFARTAGAEDLGSVLVLDPSGMVIEDSTAVLPHRLNLVDRDYFRVHVERPDVGLYVSRAFRSRLRANDPSISVSLRLPDKDGEFQGVVEGALRLNYLHSLFRHLDLGKRGSITLLRTDGYLLAREPSSEADFDRSLAGRAVFERLLQSDSGAFIARSELDGTQRFFAYRHLRGLPLILAVNIAVDDIFETWQQRALILGSLLVALCGAAVVLCALFRREILRREAAECALRESADELAKLASTDALTGLTNRRGFEIEMHWEWKRAARLGAPLCLLMIDADCFKSYNDRYGHPAGDRVLRMLGTCIEQNVRRPSDCAARHGGEEFAALLPETSLPSALAIAESIRAAVRALEIAHQDAPSGYMSVSIGVASASPGPTSTMADLVHAADSALYEAKHGGRNQVRAFMPERARLQEVAN